MSDEPEEAPEITEVRRLLAEARHTEPVPEDVAAKLDMVLAGLAPTPAVPDAPVVDLARRRRRKAAGWLVAAAAVVTAFAVGPHISLHSTSDNAETGSSANDAAPQSAPLSAHESQGTRPNASSAGGKSTGALTLVHGRVLVRPSHFANDARRARTQARQTSEFGLDDVAACGGIPSATHAVAAEYQDSDAALVFRRAAGGGQTVDLYLCGDGQLLRSAHLPAR